MINIHVYVTLSPDGVYSNPLYIGWTICIGQRKINLVFMATVLKTLGRVGSGVFKNQNLKYKDPNEKNTVFSLKKV